MPLAQLKRYRDQSGLKYKVGGAWQIATPHRSKNHRSINGIAAKIILSS